MKTKWMIIPVVALILGCSREIDTNVTYIDGEFTLYATSGENDTRTVLQQDGRVFWSPSDCITVFYGNIPGKFTSTNTEPAASAEFTGSLGPFAIDGETVFRAIYPHSNDIVTPTDEGILSIGLPWEQTGVEGTFADDLFICVAKSKDVNLHFYNVCGGVKFSLARGDIKKVVFRGNNGETLAGRMAVEFDSKGIPQVTDMTGGKSSVTLVAPDGGTFKEGAYYYLVLVPQSLTKGYTMELWTDELVETVSSETAVTVRRAAWGVLKNLGNHDSPTSIPDAVDLGLPSGLKWASFNLGATRLDEYGDYYAWGETDTHYSSFDPLIWRDGLTDYTFSSYKWNPISKYSTDTSWESDGKIVLDLEDDAAHIKLGGKWRMPTYAEWVELCEMCTWEWTIENGVGGHRVSSNVPGYTNQSIFLPAAGMWYTSYNYAGSDGLYWSSSLYTQDESIAWSLAFTEWDIHMGNFYRSIGFSIRPVHGDPAIPVNSISLDKTELELFVGGSSVLSPLVLPDNATYKGVSWSSSDESVVTVSATGIVTGVSAGSAIITVTTFDGWKTATCNVTVKESPSFSIIYYTTSDGNLISPDSDRFGAKIVSNEYVDGRGIITFDALVTEIGESAFYWCENLLTITLPEGVITIGENAFSACDALVSIILPKSVTTIGKYAFEYCDSLSEITLPEGVTNIGEFAFQHCFGLTEVTIPKSMLSIGQYAFQFCTGLNSVTVLPETPPEAGGGILYKANNCPIYVPAGSIDAYKSAKVWEGYASRIQAISE